MVLYSNILLFPADGSVTKENPTKSNKFPSHPELILKVLKVSWPDLLIHRCNWIINYYYNGESFSHESHSNSLETSKKKFLISINLV